MDESQLAPLLDTLTPDEIDNAATELQAYARHRRMQGHLPDGGVQAAPFNFKGFMKNFIKVVQVVYPVVAPLVGLDTQAVPASDQ